MNEVKRYMIVHDSGFTELLEKNNGNLVYYSDYEALRTQLAEAQKEVAKLKDDIRCMIKKAADKHLDGYRELAMTACRAEDRLLQLSEENIDLRERIKKVEDVYKSIIDQLPLGEDQTVIMNNYRPMWQVIKAVGKR